MHLTVVAVEGLCRALEDLASLLGGDEEAGGVSANAEVADVGHRLLREMGGAAYVLCLGLKHPPAAEAAPHHFVAAFIQGAEMVGWEGEVKVDVRLTVHPLITDIAIPIMNTRQNQQRHG